MGHVLAVAVGVDLVAGVSAMAGGALLRLEWAAFLISASTVSVDVNALPLNLVKLNRPAASKTVLVGIMR